MRTCIAIITFLLTLSFAQSKEVSCFDAITSKHILDVEVTEKGRYVSSMKYFGAYAPDGADQSMTFKKGSFVTSNGEEFFSLRKPMVVKNKRGLFFKAHMIVEKKLASFDQDLILVCDSKEKHNHRLEKDLNNLPSKVKDGKRAPKEVEALSNQGTIKSLKAVGK